MQQLTRLFLGRELGTIGWLLRCRLRRRRPKRARNHGKSQGTSGGLCLHGAGCRGVPGVLQQRNVDFCGENGGLRTRRMFNPFRTDRPIPTFFALQSPVQARRFDVHVMVQVENESKTTLPQKPGTTPEQTSALEESIFKLSKELSTITRNQKYFRTRENRNFSTVRSTEQRIFNFSIIESGMMVAMAGLQVFIVRFFFQGARKGINLFPCENLMFLQNTDFAQDMCDLLHHH